MSLAYTFLDEIVLRTSYGAWPMLTATAAIAISSSIVTKDFVFSPLCCFAATMSGGVLVGLVRDFRDFEALVVCGALDSTPANVLEGTNIGTDESGTGGSVRELITRPRSSVATT